MKITKSQLRQIIREEVYRVVTEQNGKLDDTFEFEYVVTPQIVGTWNTEDRESERFIPSALGEKLGFESGSKTPKGTSIVKDAPTYSM